jgi:hypothetical protein
VVVRAAQQPPCVCALFVCLSTPLSACSVVAQVRALLQQLDGPGWEAAQEQLEDIFALKEQTVSWLDLNEAVRPAILHACMVAGMLAGLHVAGVLEDALQPCNGHDAATLSPPRSPPSLLLLTVPLCRAPLPTCKSSTRRCMPSSCTPSLTGTAQVGGWWPQQQTA